MELKLNWYLIKEQELIGKLREGKLGPKIEIVVKGKNLSKDSDIEVNMSIAILFALHSMSLAFLIYYFALFQEIQESLILLILQCQKLNEVHYLLI